MIVKDFKYKNYFIKIFEVSEDEFTGFAKANSDFQWCTLCGITTKETSDVYFEYGKTYESCYNNLINCLPK